MAARCCGRSAGWVEAWRGEAKHAEEKKRIGWKSKSVDEQWDCDAMRRIVAGLTSFGVLHRSRRGRRSTLPTLTYKKK